MVSTCCLHMPQIYIFFSLSGPQLLLFLKAFTETEQTKLAMLSGILLANGTLPATILTSLFTDNIVKEGNFLYLFSYLSSFIGDVFYCNILHMLQENESWKLVTVQQKSVFQSRSIYRQQCPTYFVKSSKRPVRQKKATKQKQTPKDLWFFGSHTCVCRIVEYMYYCGTIKVWSICIPEIYLLAFLQVLLIPCEWEVGQRSRAGQWDTAEEK